MDVVYHTRRKYKYHIILVPKFRRKVEYGKLRKDIGEILRRLCDCTYVEIIEARSNQSQTIERVVAGDKKKHPKRYTPYRGINQVAIGLIYQFKRLLTFSISGFRADSGKYCKYF